MASIQSMKDCNLILDSIVDLFQKQADPFANSIRLAYNMVKEPYLRSENYIYTLPSKEGKKDNCTLSMSYLQYRVNMASVLAENAKARAEYVVISLLGPAYIKHILHRADIKLKIGENLFNSMMGLLKGIDNYTTHDGRIEEKIDTMLFNAAIRDIFEDIKKKQRRNNSQIIYINNALKIATTVHTGVFRQSGEPYIIHPLMVADMLADVNMESEIVAAALLHDVVEDSNITIEELAHKVSPRVADYVNAVTSVKKAYANYIESNEKIGIQPEVRSKEELDRETVCKLIELSVADESKVFAVCIKAADRLHNLQTLDGMSPEKIRNKIDETVRYYLPVFRYFGVNYFVNAIENQIWKIQQQENGYYLDVEGKYDEILTENQHEIQYAEYQITSVVSKILPERIEQMGNNFLQADVKREYFTPRDIYLMARDAISDYKKIKQYITKQIMPLVKLNILITGNNSYQDFDWFVRKFIKAFHTIVENSYLSIVRMEVEQIASQGQKKRVMMEIEDKYHVRILVFIYLREDYNAYCFGNNAGIVLPSANYGEPTDMLGDTITVYGKKPDEPFIIPAGSTVLDFAFKIHEEICMFATRASINGSAFTEANLSKTLYDGDRVHIEHDAETITGDKYLEARCKLDWLAVVKLESTRRHIIKWLKRRYEES